MQTATPVRGYQSSVDPCLHFGLGNSREVLEIEVTWPDQKKQVLRNLSANKRIKIKHEDADLASAETIADKGKALFQQIEESVFPSITHQEKPFDDYQKQVLLPHKLSQLGPFTSVADVDGDGFEDVYLGGSASYPGQLMIQKEDGFHPKEVTAFIKDRNFEDQESTWFDADNDGDLDLYVVSGSYEFSENDVLLQDRFYQNDGKGNFTRIESALPKIQSNGSCVVQGDYDGDGDMDLFVGGRVVPGKYPMAAKSYILRNDNGRFTDVGKEIFPEIDQLGMVTSALWSDYDQDGHLDLVVVGEWMPITFLRNEGNTFSNQAKSLELDLSNGWWNTSEMADLDNDGDIDYVLGNLGLNSKNQTSEKFPFQVYADDLDNSGSFDIILGYYESGIRYPVRGLQCSSEQVPELAKKIESYDLFGSLGLDEIYGEEKLEEALHFDAYEFRSIWLENKDGKMVIHPLPSIAQIAPTNGIVIQDWNGDQCPDLVLVGNQYPVEVETGRYDAHQGLILIGDCQGNFKPFIGDGGLDLDGDMRSMQNIKIGKDKVGVIIGVNQAPFQLFYNH